MLEKVVDRMASRQDLEHGQIVIIAARWVLVAAGLMLAVWNPAGLDDLRMQIVLILGLAGANFYLHAQILMQKPVAPAIAVGASAADIAVISLLVATQGGYDSNLFVFYFPALLALSVAFRPAVTFVLAGGAVSLYGIIAASTLADVDGQSVLTRMLMFAGVAVCGAAYWRIEKRRRGEIEDSPEAKDRLDTQEAGVA